jgi:hypothetical protein
MGTDEAPSPFQHLAFIPPFTLPDPYIRTKPHKHWGFLRSDPYHDPYQNSRDPSQAVLAPTNTCPRLASADALWGGAKSLRNGTVSALGSFLAVRAGYSAAPAGGRQACAPKRGMAQNSPPARGLPPVVEQPPFRVDILARRGDSQPAKPGRSCVVAFSESVHLGRELGSNGVVNKITLPTLAKPLSRLRRFWPAKKRTCSRI